MRIYLLSILTTGFIGLTPTASAIEKGQAMPTVSINHIEAGALNNNALQGKVTVVNFWATWCAACKVEIKEMETAFRTLMNEDEFQMAFVSLDKDPTKAQTWFDQNVKLEGFKKRLFKDPEFKAAELLNVDSFPMTMVIDQQGKIVHIQRGFKEGEGTTDAIANTARELLSASAH